MKIEILGYKEVEAHLNKLPIEAANVAVEELQDYLLNVMRSDQPPKNYVTRKRAYGVSFFSDKQRRYFFAALKSGAINVPYKRSQDLSKGWHIVNRGLLGYLVNYVPYAVYVYGERKQSRHEALVGWKKPSQQIKDRIEKINKIIDAAARKAIKKLHLS